MQGLHQHRLRSLLPPKQIDQIETELFTSLFVLQSRFRFNPVPETPYYLYQWDGEFHLLMVGPRQWHRPYRGRYIGECRLHEDRTWTLSLDQAMSADTAFLNYLHREREKLRESLITADTVEQALPVLEERYGYYGRILAYILGRSLDISMQGSGIKGLSYAQARGLLTQD